MHDPIFAQVNGDIPPKVKNDAHAVILDFIRSRPPLKPVSNLHVLLDFSLTVKAARHECVIRTSQP